MPVADHCVAPGADPVDRLPRGTASGEVVAVVVAWNAEEHLPACLASLDRQDHDDLRVIVVDNASTDRTPTLLLQASMEARRSRLEVRTNATNRGFSGGVNDGLAGLSPTVEAVLLVNPDVVLAPDLVSRCLTALRADARRGSVQPRVRRLVPGPGDVEVLDSTGHLFTNARLFGNRGEGEADVGQYGRAEEVFGASGALVLHRRAMLDDVAWRRPDGTAEPLTEDLFAYFDDVELDWRARLHGWTAWYEPEAVGWHERGGAGPRRTAKVEALNLSNRLLVVATCDDVGSLVRAAPLVVTTSLLKLVELLVTVPSAAPEAFGRMRLLPEALRRRRQLGARARIDRREIVARHVQPFAWRPWVRTWWRRIRGRAPGVARVSR